MVVGVAYVLFNIDSNKSTFQSAGIIDLEIQRGMGNNHRDTILKNLDFLVNNTDDGRFKELLHMFTRNPYVLAEILKEKSSEERKRKFYEIASKMGPKSIDYLCDCLCKIGLDNIAHRIKDSRLMLEGCSSKLNISCSETDDSTERYIIKSNPKGHVLIICNVFQQETRCGSENDLAYLKKVWTELEYAVTIQENLECDDFKTAIDNFIDLAKDEKLDSIFIFILTRGNRHKNNAREVILNTYDSEDINSEWILEKFRSVKCKHIADIPKTIFILTSMGRFSKWKEQSLWEYDRSREDNTDENQGFIDFVTKPHYSDLLVVFSTIPEHVPSGGTPFIQELCSLIELRAKTNHLIDIIHEAKRNLQKKVDRNLDKEVDRNLDKELINYENFGFCKDLYLI